MKYWKTNENLIKLFFRERFLRGTLHGQRAVRNITSRGTLTIWTATIWTHELSRRLAILNVSRNPRERIGYCIAFESSTNCLIITISRCTPDTQCWRSAGAEDGAGANAGSKLKFNSSGARNHLSEGATTVPVLPVNCGEDRPVQHSIQEVTEYHACRRGWDVVAGYATIEYRDEGYTIWGSTLPQRYWRRLSRRFAQLSLS